MHVSVHRHKVTKLSMTSLNSCLDVRNTAWWNYRHLQDNVTPYLTVQIEAIVGVPGDQAFSDP